jgi:ferrous iron transport protein B
VVDPARRSGADHGDEVTAIAMRPLIAIAGNPNTGKTTLFNALTGLRAKVSNYPGVTVDRRTGTTTLPGGIADVLDIPGTYSLVARSAEEQIAIDNLVGIASAPGVSTRRPNAVIVCADATQLARSFYLLLQCQELGLPCVVALTMTDEAGGAAPDAAALADAVGCEVIPVIARTRHGLDQLAAAVDRAVASTPVAPVWRWTPSPALRARIEAVGDAIATTTWPPSDALALWALSSIAPSGREGRSDFWVDDELDHVPAAIRAAVTAQITTAAVARATDDEAVLARWAWLDTAIAPLARRAAATPAAPTPRDRTQRIDRVLLHRVWGFAVFVAIMFVMFMSLFAWADPAITLVEDGMGWLAETAREALPDGVVADFVADGVINGVGSVLVFLPQILLLFLFLGLLEDVGYLARIAYLMDRIMRSMNLHGRAFVPMLSGFACAIPAIMATRTMERRRDRLLTMMVVPLMTCSSRLPVYSLVIAALIGGSAATQSLILVGMYLFSVMTALIAAWVLSRVIKPLRAKRLPFVIELPPYRVPRWRDVLRMMWDKSAVFLREAGTVILACTIALWALLYFPRELPAGSPDYDALIEAAPDKDARAALEDERDGALLRNSYGGRLGHAIEPAIAPLGFDWKIGVGIVGAFAAREVFVSTMGVVYSVGDDDEDTTSLREALRAEKKPDGTPAYTALVGLSLMIFFALACQCFSTLAVLKRETGGYRWPLFVFAYMTALAWTVCFLVFQIGSLLLGG